MYDDFKLNQPLILHGSYKIVVTQQIQNICSSSKSLLMTHPVYIMNTDHI